MKRKNLIARKKVIDLILTGTEGVNREILLSLAHDVFGGIGSTIGNLQQLSGPIHKTHKHKKRFNFNKTKQKNN